MDKEIKDTKIEIRLTSQEKEEMKNNAKEQGFGHNLSAFVLWLWRKFGHK